ncbi:hypothetical protein Mal48_29980 [Thalassoglobus polymorphus]|uniref:Uncharacterized protein n=1 Tax=Thalassoglobus polymorphus TaxID=2527994 RepID=A0A517QQ88_9PLAN|nr:hypothetical protein Mal48_29980 [Thalassoglobus polymorphus]
METMNGIRLTLSSIGTSITQLHKFGELVQLLNDAQLD